MLRNYLSIAWRNLLRNKLFSLINIIGLSLGLAACMLISLYVAHEYSFDRFHRDVDNIYSVNNHLKVRGGSVRTYSFPMEFAPASARENRHIKSFLRVMPPITPGPVISTVNGVNKAAATQVMYADSNFFSFFSFPLVAGNPKSVLSRPLSVVISQEMANKYFGSKNPLGKILILQNHGRYLLEVTGIMHDFPSNSSINADFVVSLASLKSMVAEMGEPASPYFKTYFLLDDAQNLSVVKANLQRTADTQFPGLENEYELTPLANEHLDLQTHSKKYLQIFPWVAGLILMLALVNYMSLSTARANSRAKEIGVRKASGAGRGSVALQFYVESGLYSALAFSLGLLIYWLTYRRFLGILDIKIDQSFVSGSYLVAVMAVLFLFTVFASGSYPSLVLSSFRPIAVLSGKITETPGSGRIRKCFTVGQFVITISLVICGLVIGHQLYYMRHKETGLDRENVLMLSINKNIGPHYPSLKREVQQIAGVKNTATMRYSLYKGYNLITATDNDPSSQPINYAQLTVDEDFIPLMGIHWKIAPDSTRKIASETVFVNETLVKKLNLGPDPIGNPIQKSDKSQIGGVIKDFNYQSLGSEIGSLALLVLPDTSSSWASENGATMFVKILPNVNIPTLLKRIEQIHRKYDVNSLFQYQFADQAFEATLKTETRLANIFNLFIGLSVFIAGIGLFGLAAFSASRRTKEIGVRKVLGASVQSLALLLSRDFFFLIGIAIVIASPLAWWAMDQWLKNFPFRVAVEWWVFAVSGVTALAIALATVSTQAIRSALANPTKSLRNE